MKKIIIFIILPFFFLSTDAQMLFKYSTNKAIRYFENHPFDSTHHKESDSLVSLLKKSLSLKKEITIPGRDSVIMLYFDTYHKDTIFCPKGFTYLN